MAKMKIGNADNSPTRKPTIVEVIKENPDIEKSKLDIELLQIELLKLSAKHDDLKNQKREPSIKPADIVHKTVNVTHEVISSKDTKARMYSKELRKRSNEQFEVILNELDKLTIKNHILQTKLEQINEKPQEKQVVTIEKHTETIKEIQFKTDKRILMLIGISVLINIGLILALK